jgi:hypothetical protein
MRRIVMSLAPLLLLLAACGTSSRSPAAGPRDSGGAADSATPPAGTGTLTGAQAFSVGALYYAPSSQSCATTADAGENPSVIATAYVVLSQQPISTFCEDAGAADAGSSPVVVVAIATNQAAMDDPTPTQSLAPGSYSIGNEMEDDPDLCMLPMGTNAIVYLEDAAGDDASSLAMSGTVTLTSVSATSIEGSFTAQMGDDYGHVDGGAPQALSGTFHASSCP